MTLRLVRVVGLGSAFGADRTGWDVVSDLERRPPRLPRGTAVQTVQCRAPAVDLPGHLRGADAAVLVDALRDGRAPGTVSVWHGCAALRRAGSLSSHGIGLGEVLDLLAALGEAPRSVSLIGVSVGDDGRPLVTAVRRRAARAAGLCIEHLLDARGAAG